jgi:alpha-tubulin suppressor-like RCC1 family protein
VRSDGTVWCWRNTALGNASGELGNGVPDNNGVVFRASQVLTAANKPLTNVKAMASSNGVASCAVTTDGKLYCWGNLTWLVNKGTALTSAYAQIITTDGSTPFTGVLQASIGESAACAIVSAQTSNTVWCWGFNGVYALGLGDTITRQYPTKVLGFTNPTIVAVSSGGGTNSWDTSCALDGSNVRCWGYNGSGETGIGNTNSPVMSPSLVKIQSGATFDGATTLVSGVSSFCSLHSGGSIWCWGPYYQTYSGNFGAANVVAVAALDTDSYGSSQLQPRYLTSDGVYHIGDTTRVPNCGVLQ